MLLQSVELMAIFIPMWMHCLVLFFAIPFYFPDISDLVASLPHRLSAVVAPGLHRKSLNFTVGTFPFFPFLYVRWLIGNDQNY